MKYANISSLDSHECIGWDVDRTLIYGPLSARFRQYVRRNPHKKHWLITFRTDLYAERVYDELATAADYPLGFEEFQGLVNLPIDIEDNWVRVPNALDRVCDYNLTRKQERILIHNKLNIDDVVLANRTMWNWKPLQCVKLGCGVLVDDIKHLKGYCHTHGVSYFNSMKGRYYAHT